MANHDDDLDAGLPDEVAGINANVPPPAPSALPPAAAPAVAAPPAPVAAPQQPPSVPGWKQRLAGGAIDAAGGAMVGGIPGAVASLIPTVATSADPTATAAPPPSAAATTPDVQPPTVGDPSKKVTRYAIGQAPQGHYVPGGFAPTVSNANRAAYDTAARHELEARSDIGQGKSDVEATKAEAQGNTAEFLDRQAKETMKRAEEGKQSYRDALAQLAQQQQQAAKMGIDPNRLERNMSGGQRLMYGIAAALSGAAAGFNRQSGNLAVEQHEHAIDRDIAAQHEDINSKRLAVADMKDRIAILSKVADDQERIAEHAEQQRAAAQSNRGGAAVTSAGASLPKAESNLENSERGQEQALTRGLRLERPVAGGMVGGPTKEQLALRDKILADDLAKGMPVDAARAHAARAVGWGGGRPDLAAPQKPGKNGGVTPETIAAAANAAKLTAPGTSVSDSVFNPIMRHVPGSDANLAVFAQQADDAQFSAALKPLMGGRSIQQIDQFMKDHGLSTGGQNLTPAQREQVSTNRANLVKSMASGHAPGGGSELPLDTEVEAPEP